jgi:UDP-GlcNAc:undecaprenyl-phosphate GlcNAc-1-phosphate transferase
MEFVGGAQDHVYLSALVCALVAFCISYGVMPAILALSARKGLLDFPGIRRVHTTPTPRLGGVGVVMAFVCCVALFYTVNFGEIFVTVYLQQIGSSFVLGLIVLAVTGCIDDVRGIKPRIKLLGQALAAVIMVQGMPIEQTVLGIQFPHLIAAGVYWILTIVLINAFNLIDGVDGLATPLAAVALLGLFGSVALKGEVTAALVVASFIGALGGFYPYNRYPARMFLGDCGSLCCGYVFAYAALLGGTKTTALTSALVPLLAASVPLLDLVFAVWRRGARQLTARITRAERRWGIMTGDLEHLHHRLIDCNVSSHDVAAVLILVNSVAVLVGLVSLHFGPYAVWGALLLLVVLVSIVLYLLPAPEIVESGRLLHEVLVQIRSRLIAAAVFLGADGLVLCAGWMIARVLTEEGVTGILSTGEFAHCCSFVVTILPWVVVTDLFLQGVRARWLPLAFGVGIAGWAALAHYQFAQFVAITVVSSAGLFSVRRSVATLEKMYNSEVVCARVSLYDRLRRASI